MLVMPIVNKGRVMNVEVSLKDISKVRSNVYYDHASSSDIFLNRAKFSTSSFANYEEGQKAKASMDFIRARSLLNSGKLLVTTKNRRASKFYDVYSIPLVPKKVNDSLDELYGRALLDLENEIPEADKRGKYLSLKELKLDQCLTDDKILSFQRMIENEKDSSNWSNRCKAENILNLEEILKFLNNFEWVLLTEHTIPEESLKDTLKSLEAIHTRDYRNLKKYYEIAESNALIYMRLSYVYKIIHNKPFALIQTKKEEKKFIKKRDEVDEGI